MRPVAMSAIRHSPAAERNQGPILAALERLLPRRGVALEIASGTGQHAAHFAAALAQWQWQPSDVEPAALASIDARCAGLANVRPALVLDVMRETWPGVPPVVDAIFCANMLHISPWPTCAALMQGAARHLAANGVLVLYGPYVVDGEPTAPSNVAFDADLRARPRLGPTPPGRRDGRSRGGGTGAARAHRHARQQPAPRVGACRVGGGRR